MTYLSKLDIYRPSGRISWRLPVYILLIGFPVAALLAWLYASALMTNLPFLLTPVVSFLFAIACALLGAIVVEKGHSRSVAANTVTGILLCFVFIWLRWLFVFRAMGSDEAVRFMSSNPWAELQMLWELADTDSLANSRMLSPVARCIVWALEVGFFALFMAGFSRLYARNPYSEIAHCWPKVEKLGELFPVVQNMEALANDLLGQRINALLGMTRADMTQINIATSEWYTLKLTGRKIENNLQDRWLDIEWVTHKRTDEGKIKTSSGDSIKAWLLTHEEYAELVVYMNPTMVDSDQTKGQTDASYSEIPKKQIYQELKPAYEALETKNFETAIALAEPFRKYSVILMRTDALRLCALGKSGLKRWAEAYADFDELFELEPNVQNAMQLATTSVMMGDLLCGETWFKRADELNHEHREIQPAQLRTRFLSALEQAKEFSAAKPYMDWLADGYRALTSTDSHFLHMGGFPFLSTFLERSLHIMQVIASKEEIQAWYEDLHQGVDKEGQAAIDDFLRASGYR